MSRPRRRLLALVTVVVHLAAPAASAAPSSHVAPPETVQPPPSAPPPVTPAPAGSTGAAASDQANERDDESAAPAAQAPAPAPPATVGGLAGNVGTDAKAARRAEVELEGQSTTSTAGLARSMPPLQAGGWWTLFGSVAVASLGGVFAGLAESQEDRALRIASELDAETGAQPDYADVRGDYDDALRRGHRYEVAAWSLLAVSGAALVGAITLFGLHARRSRAMERRTTWTGRGLELRF